MPVIAKDTVKQDQFLASFSGALERFTLERGKIRTAENILNSNRWSHVYWPSYDEEKDLIYFVAKDSHDQELRTNIYRFSFLSQNKEPIRLIINARHPSLSPDNNLMAFYRHPNQLWIQRLEEINERKVASDIANYQPCVWVSNTRLLYVNISNNLILLDLAKGEKQKTGFNSIVPGALSPNGKKVLCGSSDGKKIYYYSPFSNELKLIKENKFRSIGTSFIWLPDGTGFFFTMQKWSNILSFNESRDLFVYTLSDQKETFLVEKIALFGGVFLPSR
jgi:hypothetical protein